MKWKNIDAGPSYYHITATLTEWLPLLRQDDIRRAVCHEIKLAMGRFGVSLNAFVIMPDHLHLVVAVMEDEQIHQFLKCWRGRSARHIIDMLIRQSDLGSLAVMARHANGGCRYAAWKEQARAQSLPSKTMLLQRIEYVHANPVRAGLVELVSDWEHSSWNWYDSGKRVELPVTPPEDFI